MVGRQNTRSSNDGARSTRTSKRYSMTALYLSMNANPRELEIEDDLARGTSCHQCLLLSH
jgi:Ras GTPase-activating-like protein IQGAP2/3